MTRVSTFFLDFLHVVHRYDKNSGWTRNEPLSLWYEFDGFKTIFPSVFVSHQMSGIKPHKWHLLYHIWKVKKYVGGNEYLHGSFYKSSHKFFKTGCRKTSGVTSSAMDVVVTRQNKIFIEDRYSKDIKCVKGRENGLKQYTLCNGTGISVQQEMKRSLEELQCIFNGRSNYVSVLHGTSYGKP